ncbi:MAG: hypothetical protein IJW59_02670 [Clostridia bacterium]|nr:hypothetical protein [Clostridia bacterium]
MGGGFVSGREIAEYFCQNGSLCYAGIGCAVVLFFLLTLFFLLLSEKICSFDMFSKRYFGKLFPLLNILLSISVLIIISSMFAGTIALAEDLNISIFLMLATTIILCFFALKRGGSLLTKINIIVVPLMLIFLLVVSSSGFDSVVKSSEFDGLFDGVVYVFINIVSLGMFALEIGKNYTTRQKVIISLITSLIIGSVFVFVGRAIVASGAEGYTLPNIMLAKENIALRIGMRVCVYFGLFTTLISNVFVLANYLNNFIKEKTVSVLLVLSLGLFMGSIGFTYLVRYAYLITGILGILMVLVSFVKEKRIGRNLFFKS